VNITVPVSVGELVDKITILEIKCLRIQDVQKKSWAKQELAALEHVFSSASGQIRHQIAPLRRQLLHVNLMLWDVEDQLRDLEAAGNFGAEFVTKARSVYQLNDQRFMLKHEINKLSSSAIMEVKSYSYINQQVKV
jgi:hypothetical protein